MGRAGEQVVNVSQLGGVDLFLDASKIDDNRFRKLRNYYPPRGRLKILGKRQGSIKYNASPIATVTHVDGLIRGYHNDGTKSLLAMVNAPAGDDILAGNDGAGTWASLTFAQTAAPGSALVATVGAVGTVDAGLHSYVVTFLTINGETAVGARSNQVTAAGGGSQIALASIPIGPAGTLKRGIYRRKAGDTGSDFLLQIINDNTTTAISDNTADALLGAVAPTVNTTGGAAIPTGKRWTARNWPLLTSTYFAHGDGAVPIQRTKDFLSRASLVVTGIPDAALGAFVEIFHSRLVTARTALNPNFYYFFDVASDTSCPAINFGRINEAITAMGKYVFGTQSESLREQLFLWSAHAMYWVSGDPTVVAVEQVSNVIGCKSPKTVVNTPIGLIFLGSDRQVYIVRANGEPERIGNRIRPDLLGISETRLINAAACYHNGFYKLTFAASGATNSTQYWADLDPVMQGNPEIEWYGPMEGMNLGCFVVEDGPDDALPILGGDDSAGTVYALDQAGLFSDLGVAITGEIWSKEFDEGDPVRQKIWPGFYFGYLRDTSGQLQVTAVLDSGASVNAATLTWIAAGAIWGPFPGEALWDIDTWGGDTFAEDVVDYPNRLVGKTVQLRLVHAAAVDWKLRDFTRKSRLIQRLP